MNEFSRNDLDLYVMGAFDGDIKAIEDYLAGHPAEQAYVAEQARLELQLKQVGAAACFCAGCDEVVTADRCDGCGAAVRAGGYIIDKVLVETAHGRLYLARDSDGQRVALKELAFVQTPDAAALAAFERETRFLRALEHPAIPRFVASFREGDGVHTRLYLAQEFIDGESLADRLQAHFFTEDEVIDIAGQVLEVLVYLQGLSPIVVHRDIKPANLIRRGDGSIAVVDFGAALDQGQTMGSTAIGTYGYMPLEQMAGIVDSTTDLYALGASLWHLLTRREPWEMLGKEADTANVSDFLSGYLSKMTAQSSSDRFPSASAAREALEARDTAARPASLGLMHRRAKRERAPRRRGFSWASSFTAVTIVALGIGGSIAHNAIDSERAIQIARTTAEQRAMAGSGPTAEVHSASTEPLGRNMGAAAAPLPRVPKFERKIDLVFDGSLHDGIVALAKKGGVNIVLPDDLRGPLKVGLHDVPWHVAFEEILESHGLSHLYLEPGSIIVVAPAEFLEQQWKTTRLFKGALPPLRAISLDRKFYSLSDLLSTIAERSEVNIILPSHIRGTVTIHADGASADAVFKAVLLSKGLWYTYQPDGRLLRIDVPEVLADHEL